MSKNIDKKPLKSYINYPDNTNSYSFSIKYSFDLIFKKIEVVFFCGLSIAFLLLSKFNHDFRKNVSLGFVEATLPVVHIAAFPFNSTIDLLTNFSELAKAKKENKILKEENQQLKNLYIKAIYIQDENKILHDTLRFVSTKSSNFKVARIIARSHQVFNQTLFIDAGENREIKEGNLVVGSKGVIGRIAEVDEDKSRVITINDASSRIPVVAAKSRVRGILAGNNSSSMEILYLPKNHKIEKNDWIYTSGDGDTLPPGLLIGVVKKVDQGFASVKMVENISNLDIVTIIDY
jgi:rod shape-determining protein MreC